LKIFKEEVKIKKATPEDFEKVINVITNAFDEEGNQEEQYLKSKNKFEYLFKNNWGLEEDHIGYKLEKADGEIVGFWSCIFSVRQINGKEHKVCNFSTWAVKKNYRNYSLLLTKAVNDLKDYSLTILSSDETSLEVFTKLYKFKPLEENLIIIPPLPPIRSSGISGYIFFSGKDSPPPILKDDHKQLFSDHRKFNASFLLVNEGKDYCFFILKKRKMKHLPFAYMFYMSNPEIFWRHIAEIRYRVNKQLKTFALIGEERKFRFGRPFFSFKKALPRPFLYKSKDLGPEDLDGLYSEYFLIKNL
tara:strand:- start:5364 stop:6272 length:909 start_codon:yes stop_codon:yes gene_type:complete